MFIFIFLLILVPNANAISEINQSIFVAQGIYTDNQGNFYTDSSLTKRIVEVFVVGDEGLTSISINEYAELKRLNDLNKNKERDPKNKLNKKEPEIVPATIGPLFYEYDEWTNVGELGATELASDYWVNTTHVPFPVTEYVEVTKSHTFSVNLGSGEKAAIAAGASYTYCSTATYTHVYGPVDVPPGYQMWLEYTPMLRHSWGYLSTYYGDPDTGLAVLLSEKSVTTHYPVKTSTGALAGYLVLCEEELQ